MAAPETWGQGRALVGRVSSSLDGQDKHPLLWIFGKQNVLFLSKSSLLASRPMSFVGQWKRPLGCWKGSPSPTVLGNCLCCPLSPTGVFVGSSACSQDAHQAPALRLAPSVQPLSGAGPSYLLTALGPRHGSSIYPDTCSESGVLCPPPRLAPSSKNPRLSLLACLLLNHLMCPSHSCDLLYRTLGGRLPPRRVPPC